MISTATAYGLEFFGSFLLVLSYLTFKTTFLVSAILSLVVLFEIISYSACCNPIVSIALCFNGNFGLETMSIFILCQIIGGVAAVYVYKFLTPFFTTKV